MGSLIKKKKKKTFWCFYRVVDTRVEVLGNDKCFILSKVEGPVMFSKKIIHFWGLEKLLRVIHWLLYF